MKKVALVISFCLSFTVSARAASGSSVALASPGLSAIYQKLIAMAPELIRDGAVYYHNTCVGEYETNVSIVTLAKINSQTDTIYRNTTQESSAYPQAFVNKTFETFAKEHPLSFSGMDTLFDSHVAKDSHFKEGLMTFTMYAKPVGGPLINTFEELQYATGQVILDPATSEALQIKTEVRGTDDCD